MPSHDYSRDAHRYALREFNNTDYLAFREIAARHLLCDLQVLDLGCGTGRSARFLKQLGNQVTGADVSPEMLEQARSSDPDGDYHALERGGPLPFEDARFDAVFTSWMLVELGDPAQIEDLLRECARVVRPGGTAVAVTNTADFYRGDWVSIDISFPENRSPLQSGQPVKAVLLPERVTVEDYFWTDDDYRRFFASAGWEVVAALHPLGLPDDPIIWKDEARLAPFVVYHCRRGATADRSS